jgi:hypothetical protein
MNLRSQTARLDPRRHFFSNRVVDGWNLVPIEIKNARNVHHFKIAYRNTTEKRYGGNRLVGDGYE